MILRLSQKLSTKIHAGALAEMKLDENPLADWSSHLFIFNRAQHIILMNTASFYCCVMLGKGITSLSSFNTNALDTIRDFTADVGQQFVFRKFIAPSFEAVNVAKPLNRSAIGSMNEHVQGAKYLLEDGLALSEIGYSLNDTPMSALVDAVGKKYSSPKEVFCRLMKQMPND